MEEYYGNTSDAAIELFVSLAVIAGLGWGLLMIFATFFSKKRNKEYEKQRQKESAEG